MPFPRWEVALLGDELDLNHLAQHFDSDAWCVHFDIEAKQTRLVVAGFAPNDSSGSVLAAAMRQAQELSGILKVALHSSRPLKVVNVVLRLEDGTSTVFSSSSATLRMRCLGITSTSIGRDGELILPSPTPVAALQLARLKEPNPGIAKILRLSVAPDAEIWTGMYRLLEAIEHDLRASGSDVHARNWATRRQLDLFTHTASSSAAGDASRHGHERYSSPPKPMTLDEARGLLNAILPAWSLDRLHNAPA